MLYFATAKTIANIIYDQPLDKLVLGKFYFSCFNNSAKMYGLLTKYEGKTARLTKFSFLHVYEPRQS